MLLKLSLVSRNSALNPPAPLDEVDGPADKLCCCCVELAGPVLADVTVGFGVRLVLTVEDLLATNERRLNEVDCGSDDSTADVFCSG